MIQADYGKVSICKLSEGKGLKCNTKNNSEKNTYRSYSVIGLSVFESTQELL